MESFEILLKKTQVQGWPENPKSIFTSNAYNLDDKFKLWAGLKVERGSKLVIGQHGGNFGMTPMAIHESHQIEIADSWLSWGGKILKRITLILLEISSLRLKWQSTHLVVAFF